jgi:plastocyanin
MTHHDRRPRADQMAALHATHAPHAPQRTSTCAAADRLRCRVMPTVMPAPRRWTWILAAALVLLALVRLGYWLATSYAAAAPGPDIEVAIRDFTFSPGALVVPVGTRVRWKNLDVEPHTVRSENGDFSSGVLATNESFSYRFTRPGTYRYVCSIHSQMVATIIVK